MKCFLIILSLTFAYFSLSQKPKDEIVSDKFNANLLDSLVFSEVNTQRYKNNKTKIFFSDSLDTEADSHSAAMKEADKIFYSSFKSKAGECNMIYELKSNDMTYAEFAQMVVGKWLLSPGHAKLLLGEFFLYGGSGVSYTHLKNEITIFLCYRISYWP